LKSIDVIPIINSKILYCGGLKWLANTAKSTVPVHIPVPVAENAVNVWHITGGTAKCPDAFSQKTVKGLMTVR